MRLGSISLWGADVDSFRRQIREAEARGHEIIGVGDTPSAWQDLVVTLSVAAGRYSRIHTALCTLAGGGSIVFGIYYGLSLWSRA